MFYCHEIQSNTLLNFVTDGTLSFFWYNHMVMALSLPYLTGCSHPSLRFWTRIFLIVFLPLIFNSTITFSLSGSFTKIFVSKASLVLTQLKLPMSVFSRSLAKSASDGRAIKHLLLLRCTQPDKLFALLHFLELYLNIF